MNPSRYLAAFILTPILAFSWLLLMLIDPRAPPALYVFVGYMVGTLFAQPSLAAAWVALGPGPLLWRLPLSLGWTGALVIAYVLQASVHGQPSHPSEALIVAAALIGQWLVVQLPLWGLRVVYGVRLRHASDPPESTRDRQFGIRQVMILTFIVAVVLGVCRWVVAETAVHFQDMDWSGLAIITFLALAGIIMNFPLLIAALLPRYWLPAIGVVLVLIALGTWYELPLLLAVGGPGVTASNWLLVAVNGFQAAWVLGVVALVRRCGYSIERGAGEFQVASTSS
jgi:hypothetical protein